MHIFFIFYLNFCYKKIFKKLFLKKKKNIINEWSTRGLRIAISSYQHEYVTLHGSSLFSLVNDKIGLPLSYCYLRRIQQVLRWRRAPNTHINIKVDRKVCEAKSLQNLLLF